MPINAIKYQVIIFLLLCFVPFVQAEQIKSAIDPAYKSLDNIIEDLWEGEVLEVEPKRKPLTLQLENISNPKQKPMDIESIIAAEISVEEVITTPVPKPNLQAKTKEEDYAGLGVLMDSIETNYSNKIPVIVIDAGHGGKDPGTIGYGRTKEKHVVLSYALALKRKLEKSGKYKAFVTRKNDKFLPLRKRIKIARVYNADMFISIHADSAANKKARGLSVYTLSERASDKEAAALARKENKVDIVAGIDLSGLDRDVSDALIDLSFRDAKNKSIIFAKSLHKNLKNRVVVRTNSLHSAGFVVLKNSNMASVLIELGYLSNRKDTKNLKKSSYREKVLTGIVKSIDEYFKL